MFLKNQEETLKQPRRSNIHFKTKVHKKCILWSKESHLSSWQCVSYSFFPFSLSHQSSRLLQIQLRRLQECFNKSQVDAKFFIVWIIVTEWMNNVCFYLRVHLCSDAGQSTGAWTRRRGCKCYVSPFEYLPGASLFPLEHSASPVHMLPRDPLHN